MNGGQIVQQRMRLGLLDCPTRDRRERVVSAMAELFREGRSLEDIRAICSGSPSAWRRAQAWWREDRMLDPDQPLQAGLVGGDLARGPALAAEIAERFKALEQSRGFKVLNGNGWSWMRRDLLRSQRERLKQVRGVDVGDPIADAFYLASRERREANRAKEASA